MQKTKWISLIVVSACASTIGCVGSLCFAQTAMNKTAMQQKENLFVLIVELERSLPFRSETITKIIRQPFIVNAKESDEYEICLRTPINENKLISEIWVREPVPNSKDIGGLIAFRVNPNVGQIKQEDIIKHYGKNFSIVKLPFYATPDKVEYLDYDYTRDWGTLTFQISNRFPYCLTGGSLSSYKPPNCL